MYSVRKLLDTPSDMLSAYQISHTVK